ncbi:MAG TPA: sodium-independent anion transporter, partial [Porphyromonadaceae bacterium]|nr:sodium-independent anion transporter [Porphyromonadaceae bacterium]
MINVNNGARTPIAGVFHALVLVVIFFFLMPLAEYIPIPCLAAVLLSVAYNMFGWRSFKILL